MKRPFGLGVGLAVLTCLPDPASAQCFAAPRRAAYYQQPVQYYSSTSYYTPGQVTYLQPPMPQTGTSYLQSQPPVYFATGQTVYPAAYSSVTASGSDMLSGDTRHTMHRLWDDHVLLTRFFLLSALADLPDKETASLRLAKHQTDIGNAVKSVLGEAAGEKLATLLKDRVQTAADLIAATKANDAVKKADVVKKLQTNADDIGTFLTGVNPQAWQDQVVKGVLREHTDLLISAIDARARQDWSAEIAAFDKSRAQIRLLADLMANGLGAPTTTTIPVQQTTSGRRFRR
jgi:hypothetical protein